MIASFDTRTGYYSGIITLGVADRTLDERRRSISVARVSRPLSDLELEINDFVPGEADIFGMSERDESDHRTLGFEVDIDEGLVPSSRLAMPERVSIVMTGNEVR